MNPNEYCDRIKGQRFDSNTNTTWREWTLAVDTRKRKAGISWLEKNSA
jgi:hypothetical protein